MHNRIMVAPMCVYSANNGHLTPFHLVHLGGFAMRGAGLTIVEATGVQARGRLSPGCPGLWQDSQVEPLKQVVDFVHAQGHKIGIQLAHGGRKASTHPPWVAEANVGRGQAMVAHNDEGGWEGDVWGPSTLPYGPGCVDKVHQMTIPEIEQTVRDFASAAKRAVKAGVDIIEIHAAHGYLLCSFLSPLSNVRDDHYGGKPFENRTRMLFDVIKAIRSVIPDTMPLFLRISATEWVEGGWDVEDSIKLAKMLPEHGVDLLDVSSGGNMPQQKIVMNNGFQVGIAGRMRKELRAAGIDLPIGAVGFITQAEPAAQIVERGAKTDDAPVAAEPTKKVEADHEGTNGVDGVMLKKEPLTFETESGATTQADVILVARQFLREPEWVLRVAHQLGVDVNWPHQYARAKWSNKLTLGAEVRKEGSKI